MTSRILKGAATGIALLIAASACTGTSGSGDDPTTGAANSGPDYSSITGWTDTCDVFDVDKVTSELHIEAYTDGPVSLGPNDGTNFVGAVKCNSFFDFPDYELPEGFGERQLTGWMYMVVAPYGTTEEAASAYQTMFDSAASQVRERPEDEQAVDEVVEGDWDQGAILASVGSGNAFRAMYQKESYTVYIEFGYDPDPGVQQALSNTDMDTYGSPTYEFTPPELAEWFKSDYLPGLDQTITAKLEG